MVSALEKSERIKGQRIDGRVYFDAKEIAAFADDYSPPRDANGIPKANHRAPKAGSETKIRGSLAAEIFACFKRGMVNVGDVVEATKAPPHLVRQMWAEWKTPLGQVDKAKADAEKKRKEREDARHKSRSDYMAKRARIELIKSGKLPAETLRKLAKDFEP